MSPGDEQRCNLKDKKIGSQKHVGIKDLCVAFLQSENSNPHALADQVRAEQYRDAQPERELNELSRPPFEMPPVVKRPESERGMHGKRGIKQQRSDRTLPPRHVEPKTVFH